jgi:release factor glutamine methyltransferase
VTLGDLQRSGRERLARAGIPSAALDATLLLCHAAGVSREIVMAYPERAVSSEVASLYEVLLQRRVGREPVSRILGRREFWSLDLAIGEAVLDPRPDTETLVAAALAWLGDRPRADILDLGTGSGCILLALLHERPRDVGIGLDISASAAQAAAVNARALGLADRAAIACGSWTAPLADGVADLVVSNPPYIRHGDIEDLEPEVARFDPPAALDGGSDGLDAYRAICSDLARILKPEGAVFLEIGIGQEQAVASLLTEAGAATVGFHRDLSGRIRVVSGEFSPGGPKA